MSTQYRIRYSPAALDDLKDIFAYIATELRSPETASKQIHRINQEICSLDFMPCRYEQVDWEPWKSMGMRRVPVNHFVVFYTVAQKLMVVTVIRIVYGGRDLRCILDTADAVFCGVPDTESDEESQLEPLHSI